MKKIDVIFAAVSGLVVAWIATVFFSNPAVLILYVVFPVVSVFCLWIACLIGKKFVFVFQAAKFFLVGAFATVVDLAFFEAFVWIFSFLPFAITLLLPKIISFIVATILKFGGNKYWAFSHNDNLEIKKEFIYFFLTTSAGLLIDVGFFYYLTRILGPQFAILPDLWVKLSVVLSAFASAIWSFCSYKFFVFKK